ncbi:hypothetical protein [Embleya sp. NPDC005971]|uniref:hypothetical protein n=1 Tax=Embleya sp. NPDC005971 TaxID=3156724 RepID=UPI0033F5AAB5
MAESLVPVTTQQSRPARSSMTRARWTVFPVVAAAAAFAFGTAPFQDRTTADGWIPLADIAGGMGCYVFLRGANVARKPMRLHGPNDRYLSTRTWTGTRTIDLADLRLIRGARLYPGAAGTTVDVILRDAAGTRVTLRDERDLGFLREHVVAGMDASRIRVARLARADLGLGPARRWRTAVYTACGLFEMITPMSVMTLPLTL